MKNYIKLVLVVMALFGHSVFADVVLKDNSDILGKWKLTSEATKIDGEKKQVKVEWDFKSDGTLLTTSTDSVGRTKEMKIAVKYSIENGEIKKQTKPGQEKYESCKVLEKDGNNMVLKCMFLFYFLTKI
ncbi:MAG: hypothetical protein K9K84_06815 [Methylovulum sp.]|jgi:hypothetical protein|nr:hypothetical protein [Methylovulum sp.]